MDRNLKSNSEHCTHTSMVSNECIECISTLSKLFTRFVPSMLPGFSVSVSLRWADGGGGDGDSNGDDDGDDDGDGRDESAQSLIATGSVVAPTSVSVSVPVSAPGAFRRNNITRSRALVVGAITAEPVGRCNNWNSHRGHSKPHRRDMHCRFSAGCTRQQRVETTPYAYVSVFI